MDLAEMEKYPDIDAYYDAYPKARMSIESDYGVWWKDDDGGTWRVTYVHETGHVYAICSSGVASGVLRVGGQEAVYVSAGKAVGPVVILGTLHPNPWDPDEPSREPLATKDAFGGDRWATVCGGQGSLAWIAERVAARSRT